MVLDCKILGLNIRIVVYKYYTANLIFFPFINLFKIIYMYNLLRQAPIFIGGQSDFSCSGHVTKYFEQCADK